MVTNLVMNGIQAMAVGGCMQVEVGQGATTPPEQLAESADEWAWVRVTDDGPGVAPEHLPHVFEPFYTTKPVGEGTGLGLAVVQAIVQEHGGWITVENTSGAGACFTVFLAAAQADRAIDRLAS